MRASHADRDQVIGTLKAAFVQGRLDKDEFDHRVTRTFASRTYADLSAVTADLPAGLADTQRPRAVRRTGGRPGRIAAAATMVYAAGWLAALLAAGTNTDAAVSTMAYLGTVIYLGVLIVVAVAALETRHDRPSARQQGRGHGPGAGGPAGRRLPPPGPGRRYPPAAPGHWHGAHAMPHRLAQPPLARGPYAGRPFRPGTAPAGG
jgi:Domain of unknown function (DUF1707)